MLCLSGSRHNTVVRFSYYCGCCKAYLLSLVPSHDMLFGGNAFIDTNVTIRHGNTVSGVAAKQVISCIATSMFP